MDMPLTGPNPSGLSMQKGLLLFVSDPPRASIAPRWGARLLIVICIQKVEIRFQRGDMFMVTYCPWVQTWKCHEDKRGPALMYWPMPPTRVGSNCEK